MYDIIIVGARCAGSPLAMLLARSGKRVLLVDRAPLPSDTVNGHLIKPAGVARLANWGLLDRVIASGAPPVWRRRVEMPDVVLERPLPRGSAPILAPRRHVLDAILLDAACRAGAEVRDRTALTGLVTDGRGRIVGVRLRSRGGELVEETGIVVGADGRHSTVAHQVGAAFTQHVTPVTAAYWAYWEGVCPDAFAIRYRPGAMSGAFPTNDGQTIVFVAVPASVATEFRCNLQGAYHYWLRRFAGLAEVLGSARVASRVLGVVDLPNFFRVSAGPGWALAGDAGHHKDPLAARGITDAFRDADALAAAVIGSMASGPAALDAALAGYAVDRDAAAQDVYRWNLALAASDHSDSSRTAELVRQLVEAEARVDEPVLTRAQPVG